MKDISADLVRLRDQPPSIEEVPFVAACERVRVEVGGRRDLVGDAFEALAGTTRVVVADEAARASVSPDKGLLLHRLARLAAPGRVVELGSAFGLSGSYLATGLAAGGGGDFVSVEAAASRSQIAASSLAAVPTPGVDIRLVVGLFDEHLNELRGADLVYVDGNHHGEPTRRYVERALDLGRPDVIVVLDDIDGYSEEMDRLWRGLRRKRRFAASGRCADIGVLCAGALPAGLA